MLNSGKLSSFLRNGLLAEAANTAIYQESTLKKSRNLSPFKPFWQKERVASKVHCRKLGKVCIMT